MKIKLSGIYGNGKYAIIDEEDFDKIKNHTWRVLQNGYAVCQSNYKTVYMHRVIMNTPKNMATDHINHNRLDNRKINLRVCTQLQNNYNTKCDRNNKSGFLGVSYCKRDDKWVAHIQLNYKQMNLGSFPSKEEAAKTYDNKAKELFGEFANLNFK